MATKTLIRSKKKHEVKLTEGTQLAQRQPAPLPDEPPVPPLIRKTVRARRAGQTPEDSPSGTSPAKTSATRKKPDAPEARRTVSTDPRKRGSQTRVEKKPASPRLPARVPADGLWESDSAIMQRMQALIQRNSQLSEQLQRLQSPSLSKGYKP